MAFIISMSRWLTYVFMVVSYYRLWRKEVQQKEIALDAFCKLGQTSLWGCSSPSPQKAESPDNQLQKLRLEQNSMLGTWKGYGISFWSWGLNSNHEQEIHLALLVVTLSSRGLCIRLKRWTIFHNLSNSFCGAHRQDPCRPEVRFNSVGLETTACL